MSFLRHLFSLWLLCTAVAVLALSPARAAAPPPGTLISSRADVSYVDPVLFIPRDISTNTVRVRVTGGPGLDLVQDRTLISSAGSFFEFSHTLSNFGNVPGSYTVTLTATGNNLGANGCKDTATKEVIVFPPPSPGLALHDACLGTATAMTDLTVTSVVGQTHDPVASRSWAVLDGPTGSGDILGTDSIVFWTPITAGTYHIDLQVETLSGCEVDAQGSVEILKVPDAAFTLELPVQAPPITVVPVNESTDAETYLWLLNGVAVGTSSAPEITFPDTGQYTLTLIAGNTLGCNDTVSKSFAVIVPRYDLALGELYPTVKGGRLTLEAALYNAGNTTIHTFDAEVSIGRNAKARFANDGVIHPGNTVIFSFDAEFEYRDTDLPYVCVWVGNPNGIDDDPALPGEFDTSNNYRCAALPITEPVISDPWPNPATNEINFAFVLPIAAPVEIEMIDPSGRTALRHRYDLPKGYSPLKITPGHLSNGLYLVRITYRDRVEVKRVVIGGQ